LPASRLSLSFSLALYFALPQQNELVFACNADGSTRLASRSLPLRTVAVDLSELAVVGRCWADEDEGLIFWKGLMGLSPRTTDPAKEGLELEAGFEN
jgi:hypothetical protein